jgi:hypothetical protein
MTAAALELATAAALELVTAAELEPPRSLRSLRAASYMFSHRMRHAKVRFGSGRLRNHACNLRDYGGEFYRDVAMPGKQY